VFQRKKPDVLVVGAGPVGLFTALALTERGANVQIVDKEWRTGTKSYALGVHAEALQLLDELGLAAPLLERARRIRKVGLYEGSDRHAEIRISDLPQDHSFLAVLRQEDLERLLVDALAKRGVKVDWSHRVGGLAQGKNAVDVTIETLKKDTMGYAVQHTEWAVFKTRKVEIPFVIGADGHASAVREGVGIGYPEVGEAAEFAVFEFETDADLGDEMRLVLAGDHTNVCWPLPGGYCRWSFQIPTEDSDLDSREKDRDIVQIGSGLYPALTEQRLHELLAERAPWFQGSVGTMRWRMIVRFERRLADRFADNRVLLLGDATHLTGPVGIQSMNVGFREGRDLADAIAGVLKGGSMSAIERWEEDRRTEWRQLLGLDELLVADDGTDPWIAARKDRLVPCFPASGEDLLKLAGQIGLRAAAGSPAR
jgi:2-polyprenyl-6-methoxyphenol hydroxylase-like FAD-dependent oxidoreductase